MQVNSKEERIYILEWFNIEQDTGANVLHNNITHFKSNINTSAFLTITLHLKICNTKQILTLKHTYQKECWAQKNAKIRNNIIASLLQSASLLAAVMRCSSIISTTCLLMAAFKVMHKQQIVFSQARGPDLICHGGITIFTCHCDIAAVSKNIHLSNCSRLHRV